MRTKQGSCGRWWSLALTLGLCLSSTGSTILYAPAVEATTVVAVTVEQLTSQSDVVLVARVGTSHSQWRGRVITTDVDLVVNHSLKGGLLPGAHLTLRLPGGDVGNISQVLHGAPSVQQDETVVVFLRRAPEANIPVFYLTHLTASVLRTSIAPGQGTVLVQPSAEGMTLSSPIGGNASARTIMTRAGVSLEQFAASIRSAR